MGTLPLTVVRARTWSPNWRRHMMIATASSEPVSVSMMNFRMRGSLRFFRILPSLDKGIPMVAYPAEKGNGKAGGPQRPSGGRTRYSVKARFLMPETMPMAA